MEEGTGLCFGRDDKAIHSLLDLSYATWEVKATDRCPLSSVSRLWSIRRRRTAFGFYVFLTCVQTKVGSKNRVKLFSWLTRENECAFNLICKRSALLVLVELKISGNIILRLELNELIGVSH